VSDGNGGGPASSAPLIESVSDTARWVAVYRAQETERRDAHFRDPYARRLAGERGEEMVRGLAHGQSSAWSLVVRTVVFDELLTRAIQEDNVDVVINLGAGLDARPYRLSLPASLRWVEVDLPAIVAYKEEKLAREQPRCRLERVALDLSDDSARGELFARVAADASHVLAMAEGLLVYLTADQVGKLASDLHAQPSFRWWLIDLVSPGLLRYMQRSWKEDLAAGDTRMGFAPAEGAEFFRRYGWVTSEFRSTMQEARRLKREARLAWLGRLLGRLGSPERQAMYRNLAGSALLQRA